MEMTERKVREKKGAKGKKSKGNKMPVGVPATSPPLSPSSPSDSGLHRATESYSPRHDGEIRIHGGDILINVKDLGNGWSIGKNVTRDTLGIFPSSIVMPVTTVGAESTTHSTGTNTVSPSRVAPPPPMMSTPTSTGQRTPTRSRQRSSSSAERQIEQVPREHDPGCPRSLQQSPCHHHQRASSQPRDYTHVTLPPHCHAYVTSSAEESPGTPDSDSLPLPPPPPPLTNNGAGVSESENDCPLSDVEYNTIANHRAKPHMVVKPNQGINNTFPHRKSSMERASSQSDDDANCARRPPPAPKKVAPPTMQRRRVEPEYGNVGNVSASHSNESIASCSHHRSSSLRSQGCAAAVATAATADPLTDEADRNNQENESMQCAPEQRERYADIKRTYYRDYRTIDCPQQAAACEHPAGFATHPQPQFKSILKNRHQKVGDSRSHHIHVRDQQQKPAKSSQLVLSIVFGLLLGGIVYLWMHYALYYSQIISGTVAGIAALMMCVSFALCRLARCCAAILLPSVSTTRGRLAFLVIITGFLIAGPVTTIHQNMRVISSSMSCSAEQKYSQAMILQEPYDTVIRYMNKTIGKLQQASSDVAYSLDPLTHRLDRVESSLQNGRVQLRGTRKTCRDMVDRAYNACTTGIMSAHHQCEDMRLALRRAYDQAYNVLQSINPDALGPPRDTDHLALQKRQANTRPTVTNEGITDICHPLATISVCGGLNNSQNTCKPSAWAGEAIQEAINHTREAMQGLENMLEFTFDAEPYFRSRAGEERMQLYRIQAKVQADFQVRTDVLQWIIIILMRVIPLVVLLLVYVAYVHVKRYMSRDTYDNIYVTKSFRDLDARRAQVAGETLLPLKLYETRFLVDNSSCAMSIPEQGIQTIGLGVFFFHVFVAFCCHMFDYVLYWVLALVARHGRMGDIDSYQSLQSGVVPPGQGFIADLLAVFLQSVHPNNWEPTFEAKDCLPMPVEPAISCLRVIAALYVFLLLTILLKSYFLRMRNALTGYFYPERRKARTVHLYNVILNQRARMPALLHQKVKIRRRERVLEEQISFCHQMASLCYPDHVLETKTKQCLLCTSRRHLTYICTVERCHGVYCRLCYDDLGRVCPICQNGVDKSEDDYEELEDDLTPYGRASDVYY